MCILIFLCLKMEASPLLSRIKLIPIPLQQDLYHWIFCANRFNGEAVQVWVYDIKNDPKVYRSVSKGTEFITNEMVVYQDHIVVTPSWPLLVKKLS